MAGLGRPCPLLLAGEEREMAGLASLPLP